MKNTQDLIALKSSNETAYNALAMVAKCAKYSNAKECMHMYRMMKIKLLNDRMFHIGAFLNRSYLDLFDRSIDSTAWMCLNGKQLRRHKATAKA